MRKGRRKFFVEFWDGQRTAFWKIIFLSLGSKLILKSEKITYINIQKDFKYKLTGFLIFQNFQNFAAFKNKLKFYKLIFLTYEILVFCIYNYLISELCFLMMKQLYGRTLKIFSLLNKSMLMNLSIFKGVTAFLSWRKTIQCVNYEFVVHFQDIFLFEFRV